MTFDNKDDSRQKSLSCKIEKRMTSEAYSVPLTAHSNLMTGPLGSTRKTLRFSKYIFLGNASRQLDQHVRYGISEPTNYRYIVAYNISFENCSRAAVRKIKTGIMAKCVNWVQE